MSRITTLLVVALLTMLGAVCAETDAPIVFSTDDYLSGQLYVSQQMAIEGEPLTITVAPQVDEERVKRFHAELTILDKHGEPVVRRQFTVSGEKNFTRQVEWIPEHNGMYQLTVKLTPEGGDVAAIEPVEAELLVPVVVPRRKPHFVWYHSNISGLRWPTLFTHTMAAQIEQLHQRGVTCLAWGGCPHAPDDRAQWAQSFSEAAEFWAARAAQNEEGYDGTGIDELGAWPCTERQEHIHGILRAMVDHKKAFQEGSVMAVWQAGPLHDGWLEMYRQTVDFLLLETYVFGRPFVNKYDWLDSKLDPIREAQAFVPRWTGEKCFTLVGLDTNTNYADVPEREDLAGPLYPGEMELVYRYLRRVAPEMMGIAFYNGGGAIAVPDEVAQRNRLAADDLFLKYYVMPVVTLQTGALGVSAEAISVTVRNLGAMDSGEVTVAVFDGDQEIGQETLETVPAGFAHRTSTARASIPWQAKRGVHHLEARIVAAPGSTVLDPSTIEEKTVEPALTLKPPCLWMEDGQIVIALSNLGLIDSGEVTVAVTDNGREIGRATLESVPVSGNRTIVTIPWQRTPGFHRLVAEITSASDSTVLVGSATQEMLIE